jgi:hypothetical protein
LATEESSVAEAQDPRPSVLVEKNTKTDLNSYLISGSVPRYIRINVAGYNIRTTPEFSYTKTDNIDFTTNRGGMFAVRKMIPLDNGVAVNLFVDGEDRWVYVPNARRHDFQFCESEACMSDLAQVLKFLQDQKITPENLAECGLSLDAQGSLIEPVKLETVAENYAETATSPVVERTPAELEVIQAAIPADKRPVKTEYIALPDGKGVPIPKPNPRRKAEAEKKPAPKAEERQDRAEPVASASRPRVNMLWEASRRSDGKQWTSYLSKALDKYGQDMIRKTRLSDAARWCPNYSKLSSGERKEFYAHLINAVGFQESGFKTNLTFDEKTYTNPRSGRIKPDRYSQGLFQISYSSAAQDAYRPACRFDYSRDRNKDISNSSLTIYDPKLQIECAVGILNHWVKKDGGLAFGGKGAHRGGARFWSTLRSNSKKSKLVRASLKRFKPCGLR